MFSVPFFLAQKYLLIYPFDPLNVWCGHLAAFPFIRRRIETRGESRLQDYLCSCEETLNSAAAGAPPFQSVQPLHFHFFAERKVSFFF